jgi:hypothetical protein
MEPAKRTVRITDEFDADTLTPEVLADLTREINVIAIKMCVGLRLHGLTVKCIFNPEDNGQPELNMYFMTGAESDMRIAAMLAVDGSKPLYEIPSEGAE